MPYKSTKLIGIRMELRNSLFILCMMNNGSNSCGEGIYAIVVI